jgi:membrane protease subunit HflC
VLQLGKIVEVVQQPGLHSKIPVVQTVRRFDARPSTLDNLTENVTTTDNKNVVIGYYAKWKIGDPATYWLAANGQQLNADDRLSALLSRTVRDQLSNRSLQQIVADDRDKIAASLTDTVRASAKDLGIDVIDVRIRDVGLLDKINDAIYDRMRSEQSSIAAQMRARGAEEAETLKAQADSQVQVILADAYRDAEKIRGEGDAKAAEIYAAAYGQDPEFYRFYRSINAYRDVFNSKHDVLVLQPNSEFFRYFGSPDGGKPGKAK